jgi:hypothetical protein
MHQWRKNGKKPMMKINARNSGRRKVVIAYFVVLYKDGKRTITIGYQQQVTLIKKEEKVIAFVSVVEENGCFLYFSV